VAKPALSVQQNFAAIIVPIRSFDVSPETKMLHPPGAGGKKIRSQLFSAFVTVHRRLSRQSAKSPCSPSPISKIFRRTSTLQGLGLVPTLEVCLSLG
jgi:hypothetical protein